MINLLPPQRVVSLKIARSNTVLRRYVELTIVSMILLFAAFGMAYYFLHAQQTNTAQTVELDKQKIEKLRPVQKQAEELSSTVNTVAGLLTNNVKFSQMLTQIAGLMPQGSVLTGLQFSIEDVKLPLAISAQVDSEQKAAILRNNIEASDLFSRADIQNISLIGEPGSTNSVPSNGVADKPSSTQSLYTYTTVINAYLSNNEVKKP